jgi:hypothetical protein
MRKLALITALSLIAGPSFAQQQQQGTGSYSKGGQRAYRDQKAERL